MENNNYSKRQYYQTSEVARILDIDPQMLRYCITPFEQYMTISRTAGGHRKFTDETIEEIRGLISLLDEKCVTQDYLALLLKGIEIKDIVEEAQREEEQKMKECILEIEGMLSNNVDSKLNELLMRMHEEEKTIKDIETMLQKNLRRKFWR